MACKDAKRTDEYHGWECTITEGACMFLLPDQDTCAEQYGEVEHTERWKKEHEIDAESLLQQISDRYYERRKSRWDILEKVR